MATFNRVRARTGNEKKNGIVSVSQQTVGLSGVPRNSGQHVQLRALSFATNKHNCRLPSSARIRAVVDKNAN